MNFNYEKIRSKMEHGGNQWTGYSDLFLVLSVVFLLLYVVSNLRSGTVSIASRSAVKAAQIESNELKRQIKTYEVLKDDYLKKGASQDEVEMYQELMGKLNLLEDGAKQESNTLYRKAQDAQDKQNALNRYQQVVKNIINANLVAQSRLKKREDVIVDKDQDLEQKDQVVDQLSVNIQDRERELDKNNQTISQIENQLSTRVQQLRNAYATNKRSKAELSEKIKKLNDESQQQITALQQTNNKVAKELYSAQAEVEVKTKESQTLSAELTRKQSELASKQAQYRESIDSMKASHDAAVARDRAEFEKNLRSAKLSADERVAKEKAYRDGIERKYATYNQKLQGMNDQLAKTQGTLSSLEGSNKALSSKLADVNGKLGSAQGQLSQTKGKLAEVSGRLGSTQGELAAAQQKLSVQRKLAERIQENFAKAGISADVDLKTGDVTIRFANEYFDTGSSTLKNGMREKVEKMIPVYAKSLFEDDKIVKRISSVEVVGFASPTYQGKYVNPESLSTENRAAVNYNMDLSYQRAKGVFEYVFDTNKMKFTHQKQLLPLVKVSGRSYLAAEQGMERGIAGGKMDNFCKVNDCHKSQKVIIKFNLKDE